MLVHVPARLPRGSVDRAERDARRRGDARGPARRRAGDADRRAALGPDGARVPDRVARPRPPQALARRRHRARPRQLRPRRVQRPAALCRRRRRDGRVPRHRRGALQRGVGGGAGVVPLAAARAPPGARRADAAAGRRLCKYGDGEPRRLRPLLLRHAAVARPPVPVRRAARHGDRPRHHRPLPPRRPRGRLRRPSHRRAAAAGGRRRRRRRRRRTTTRGRPAFWFAQPGTTGAARSTPRGCSRTSRSRIRLLRARRPLPPTSAPDGAPSTSPFGATAAPSRAASRATVYSLGAAAAAARRLWRCRRRPTPSWGGVPLVVVLGWGARRRSPPVVAGRPIGARVSSGASLRLDVAVDALERRRDLRDPGASPIRRGRAARLPPVLVVGCGGSAVLGAACCWPLLHHRRLAHPRSRRPSHG